MRRHVFEMFRVPWRDSICRGSRKTAWLWAQSAVNPSHGQFPVHQGKNREILHFLGFSGLLTGLYPAQTLDFMIKFPTQRNREIFQGIREFFGSYQGITGNLQRMGLLEMKVGHLYPISASGLSSPRPLGRSFSPVPRCRAVVCHHPALGCSPAAMVSPGKGNRRESCVDGLCGRDRLGRHTIARPLRGAPMTDSTTDWWSRKAATLINVPLLFS